MSCRVMSCRVVSWYNLLPVRLAALAASSDKESTPISLARKLSPSSFENMSSGLSNEDDEEIRNKK